MILTMKKVWIGTSGFNYKHWKGIFYPEDLSEKNWLPFYSEQFKTVEINATFYGHFRKPVFEKWADETPEDFVFTLKGPRYITHVMRLLEPKGNLEYFFKETVGLGDKFRLTLWQFASRFKLNEENFERFEKFLDLLPKNVDHAFEFRDKSWFEEKVFDLMNSKGAGFVVNDSGRFPSHEVITGKVAYIRFHGPTKLYASNYSDEQLSEWAKAIKEYKKNHEVYCYFNNDVGGFAIENARQLESLVSSR
jgi:uncharacterized protein YecE (DUF72 family)